MKLRLPVVVLIGFSVAALAAQTRQTPPAQPFGLLIKGGVCDGAGNPAFPADIGVRDGKIAAMGRLGGAAASRVIDAAGKFAAPGFIDIQYPEGIDYVLVHGVPVVDGTWALPGKLITRQTAQKGASIFDGKTFAGWEGDRSIFRIEEGAIVGGTLKNKIARNEFLCTTQTYGDFELRLKVKLLGGDRANAGIQFRTARIPNHHEVSGYQADMGVGWWGALYDESRRNKVLKGPDQDKMKSVVRIDDWNDYVVRAEGPRIQLWLNGTPTVDYVEEDPKIEKTGVICVQIHGGPPSEAWYKEIALVDLSKQ